TATTVSDQRPARGQRTTPAASARTATSSGGTTYASISSTDVVPPQSDQPKCASVHRDHAESAATGVAATRLTAPTPSRRRDGRNQTARTRQPYSAIAGTACHRPPNSRCAHSSTGSGRVPNVTPPVKVVFGGVSSYRTSRNTAGTVRRTSATSRGQRTSGRLWRPATRVYPISATSVATDARRYSGGEPSPRPIVSTSAPPATTTSSHPRTRTAQDPGTVRAGPGARTCVRTGSRPS